MSKNWNTSCSCSIILLYYYNYINNAHIISVVYQHLVTTSHTGHIQDRYWRQKEEKIKINKAFELINVIRGGKSDGIMFN